MPPSASTEVHLPLLDDPQQVAEELDAAKANFFTADRCLLIQDSLDIRSPYHSLARSLGPGSSLLKHWDSDPTHTYTLCVTVPAAPRTPAPPRTACAHAAGTRCAKSIMLLAPLPLLSPPSSCATVFSSTICSISIYNRVLLRISRGYRLAIDIMF